MLGADLQDLSIEVVRVSPDILHVKIGAPGRWEVPKKVFMASNVTGELHLRCFAPSCFCVGSRAFDIAVGCLCFV